MNALRLGGRRYDLTTRTLVMGILNPTADSLSGQEATFDLDALLRRADRLVSEGADIIDVGGVKADPGATVGEAEEVDRVVRVVEAVAGRFDVPVAADTWRAAVLDAACGAGAVCGQDISGFADPGYLPTAARHGAAVVATHIRRWPPVPDPEPVYGDLVGEVCAFLAERAGWALQAGVPAGSVILDAGLDLGKTAPQRAVLLRESRRLAALGHPLLLSASHQTFPGADLDQTVDGRRWSSLAATAYGVARGVRIVRAPDVAGTVRVVRTVAALLAPRS